MIERKGAMVTKMSCREIWEKTEEEVAGGEQIRTVSALPRPDSKAMKFG